METDEHFSPNCPKCPIVFLLPENELAVEVYSKLCSEIVVNGNLHSLVVQDYWSRIQEEEGSFSALLEKLDVIHGITKEYQEKKTEFEGSQKENFLKMH